MGDFVFPSNWVAVPLSTLISKNGLISDGDWIESKDQSPTGTVRLIQLADIGDGEFRNKSARFMTPESAENLNCTYLESGDLLIARMPEPLGRACIFPGVGQLAVTVVDVCLIRAGDYSAISADLLKYWINSPYIRNTIDANSSGTTRKRITRKKFEKFDFPLPPLAEQKAIAEKLDTLLAQVEITKARLDRIPDTLKRFRQSVLAAAVSGKLTEEWREISGSKLEEWLSTNVGAVAEVATGKTPKRTIPEYWVNGTIPWLTSAATGKDLTFEAEQFVTEFAVKQCTLRIFPAGSLLLAMYGEGKTRGQITEITFEATCNQACAVILADTCKIKLSYLKLLLQGNYQETRKSAAGGAQPNLNLKKVRDIAFSLPLPEEQAEIIRKVNDLFICADAIDKQVKAAQERVNSLTQSILAKAFRGELTAEWRAENLELITGENSAEALLAKIKTGREAAKPIRKKKKKA